MAMASLSPPPLSLSSFLISPPKSTRAASLSSLSTARRAVFGCSTLFRLVRRHIWYSTHVNDYVGTTLNSALQAYSFSLLMPQRSVDPAVVCEGLCKVIWSIEFEPFNNCFVYLTGDLAALGFWDPNLAIPLSPSLNTANLLEVEIMIPCGIHFKYNYFIRKGRSLWLISYRQGPKLSLSTPSSCKGNEPLRVRDCWLYDVAHRNPVPSWGSWLFDPSFNQDPFKSANGSLGQPAFSGQIDILKRKPPSIPSTAVQASHTEEKFSTRDEPKGKPSIHSMEIEVNCIKQISSTRDQPVEEPWLQFPTGAFLIEEFHQENAPSISEVEEVLENPKSEKISTTILINSSACNMRRIAVLENNALVELILEPLDNSVLFNNIYLGVIKEMMPKKGGALVDIGLAEPVFMVMRENRQPFVYCTKGSKQAITEGQVSGECREDGNMWAGVGIGAKVIVQVIEREGGRTGGSTSSVMLIPFPRIRSRFWVLRTRHEIIEVSPAMKPVEKVRLLSIAKVLKPAGFGLKVRWAAAGHLFEELEKDLKILLSTWDGIVEHAKSAVQAAGERIEGAVPVMLHRDVDQNLAVIYDYFPDKVESVLVDSPRSYHEVTVNLQEIAPELCGRVELYKKRTPIFDEYKIEEEINRILCKRVPLPDGGYLVIEQTEAFVSIDVNSGGSMLEKRTSQEKASLKVNLAAAKQIARELRLRDIGGIIIVDFIDMAIDSNKILVYEEMKKEVERDRSKVTISEISTLGLMEITRERVHHSDSFVISEPCKCCHATGRVEALETSFSKIEHEISRFLAASNEKPDPKKPKSWPRFLLKVDRHMCDYLTSGKRTKLAILSSSLKVWVLLKIARGFSRGTFELTPLGHGKESYE